MDALTVACAPNPKEGYDAPRCSWQSKVCVASPCSHPHACSWLTKSNKAGNSWKRRFMVLTSEGHLQYYTEDSLKVLARLILALARARNL